MELQLSLHPLQPYTYHVPTRSHITLRAGIIHNPEGRQVSM